MQNQNIHLESLSFLQQSLNIEHIGCHNQYYYHNGEKTERFTETFNVFGKKNYPVLAPTALQFIIAFSVFDSLIDKQFPHLENLSFKQKYKHLPSATCIEKIKKSVYRIIRLLRNKAVHNPSIFIESSNNNIIINNQPFAINITRDSKSILMKLIFILIENHDVADS